LLFAYRLDGPRLERIGVDAPLAEAIWIDLYRPQPEQSARMFSELGIEVPTLEDMEEIEISNRLYREAGKDYMTVILPGSRPDGAQVSGPVTFILTPDRLVTVRHHAPRPFETFPTRADRSSAGCATQQRLFLGLVEEIVARFADLLEGIGRTLDTTAAKVYAGARQALSLDALEESLRSTGREGEALSRVRLGLLSVERMLSVFALWNEDLASDKALRGHVKSMVRDMQALEIHADFLSGRVGLATDTTLGMINLSQNQTVRIVSVVAVLFLPPTLIASIYGMNFDVMPELDWVLGYPMALGLMGLSALASWVYFRWRGWL